MGVMSVVAGVVNEIEPLRRLASKLIINKYAYMAPLRPRALSMAGDYTSWPGLTDRRYSGRHLAIETDDGAPAQPDLDRLLPLFKRERFKPARDTSILFPFFAQWFVDGFLRTKWEQPPRSFRQNESNHEIDLCQIYGPSEVQTAMLRAKEGGSRRGRLKSVVDADGEEWPTPLFEQDGENFVLARHFRHTPEKDEDTPAVPGLYSRSNFNRVFEKWTPEERSHAFAVGLEHGSATLGNAAMNTLFLREHNRTAGILAAAHPDWDDDRVFETARNVTIAVLLHIVISDYIVHIAPADIRIGILPGMAERERWYRTNWISVEFALLYRWHDLVPEALEVAGESLPSSKWVRANAWLKQKGLGAVLQAASRQPAGRIGLGNTADFLLEVKRLSVEMGRACRLPSFNDYRRHYGMAPVRSFEALTRDDAAAARLRELYGSIDRLEWFVGLFAEAYDDENMMGGLLTGMVANDAFTQALTNPLLAKAVYGPKTFGPEGFAIVESTRTLAQVAARNTRARESDIGFKLG
jgi:prostaglandin-endoperoxide synthase 2